MCKCNVTVLNECGFKEAMLGLSLAFDKGDVTDINSININKATKVAKLLAFKGGGHSKNLESICVWLDMTMPVFWWVEFATYRIGTSAQSQSTMHTIKKRPVSQDDFYKDVSQTVLDNINSLIQSNADIDVIKNELPTGFLQRRVVCTNYLTLQNMIKQRWSHKLRFLWRDVFCQSVLNGVKYPELLFYLGKES